MSSDADRENMALRKALKGRDPAVLVFTLLTLVPPVAFAWKIVTAGRMWFVDRVPDDAFYYLEIAQRISRGEGATLDGLHQTNGFHPLWQMITAGLATMFHGWPLVRAAFIVEVLLFVATLVVIARWLRPMIGSRATAFATMVASFWCTSAMVNGMESAVLCFTIALLGLVLMRAERERNLWSFASTGGALGAVTLARLDFGIPIVLVALPVLTWRWRSLRSMAAVAAGGVLIVAPFVIWSAISIGHLLPVSGVVKQRIAHAAIEKQYGGYLSGPYVHHLLGSIGTYIAHVLAPQFGTPTNLILLAAAIVGAVLVFRTNVDSTPPVVAMCVVGALVAAKALTDLLVTPAFASSNWYTVVERLVVAIAIGALAWHAVSRINRSAWLGIAALAVLPGMALHGLPKSNELPPVSAAYNATTASAAEWIATDGPSGVYGGTDNGLFAFVADKKSPVVNLDGLANSYDYANRLQQKQPPLQLYRSQGVRYFISRRDVNDTTSVPACARVLDTPFSDVVSLGAVKLTPLHVWDLSSCPA